MRSSSFSFVCTFLIDDDDTLYKCPYDLYSTANDQCAIRICTDSGPSRQEVGKRDFIESCVKIVSGRMGICRDESIRVWAAGKLTDYVFRLKSMCVIVFSFRESCLVLLYVSTLCTSGVLVNIFFGYTHLERQNSRGKISLSHA